MAGDIGIAHTRIHEYRGTHCGIFYSRDDQIRLLHLALHLILMDEVPNAQYGFVSTNLLRTQRRSVSKLCRLIVSQKGIGVPYGFRFGVVINADGTLPALLPGDGFTCTTFVLAILKTVNVIPIDASTWPTDANPEWQQMIIDLIRNNEVVKQKAAELGVDLDEHVHALEEQGNTIRITPQEVAAAFCTQRSTFDDLKQPAEELVAFLRSNFSVLGGREGDKNGTAA